MTSATSTASSWTRFLNVPAIIAVAAILAVWEVTVRTKLVDLISFPSPSAITVALIDLVGSGEMVSPVLHTLWVVVVASLISLAIGLALGIALGLSRVVQDWSMASVDFLRTLPMVALLPVAVMLWGPSTTSELIVTVFATTWVMAVNVAGGFTSLHPRLNDVALTFGIHRPEAIRKIWMPALSPTLLVGARLVVVANFLTAVIAETLINPAGLGWAILRAQQALQPENLWAYAVVAGFIGYLLNLVLVRIAVMISPGARLNPALAGL